MKCELQRFCMIAYVYRRMLMNVWKDSIQSRYTIHTVITTFCYDIPNKQQLLIESTWNSIAVPNFTTIVSYLKSSASENKVDISAEVGDHALRTCLRARSTDYGAFCGTVESQCCCVHDFWFVAFDFDIIFTVTELVFMN